MLWRSLLEAKSPIFNSKNRISSQAKMPDRKKVVASVGEGAMGRQFDALVVGAGAGGISAAARLTRAGYRVLLVEAQERVGGRASTRAVDGFLCNTGALVIEKDGAVGALYADLALTLTLYEVPRASTAIKLGKTYYSISEGLLGKVRTVLPRLLEAGASRWSRLRPGSGESTRDWIGRFSRNKALHGLIDNLVGAMFAVPAEQFPADLFLRFFSKDTAYKHIGMPIGGTRCVWEPIVDYIDAHGGETWVNAAVERFQFGPDGQVTGARIRRDGQVVEIGCAIVVSNMGPDATSRFVADVQPDYAKTVAAWSEPAAILTAHFASRTPLADFPCLALYAHSRRLVYAGNFSAPELKRAPPGWHLYCAASVPRPATGAFDVEAEKALLIEDIKDHFPGFEESMLLTIDVTAHAWPAQRAVAGRDLPVDTPVANLWNVGDGVKPWGMSGTASCAESARVAVDQILAKYPLEIFQRHPQRQD